MIIKLDLHSTTPIYVQLRNEIVLGIGSGDIKIGESLPSVRRMAEDIGVNSMTVNKAYNILKNEGFIQIDRRHGAKIAPVLNRSADFSQRLEGELKLLITEAKMTGLDEQSILNLCRNIIEDVTIKTVKA